MTGIPGLSREGLPRWIDGRASETEITDNKKDCGKGGKREMRKPNYEREKRSRWTEWPKNNDLYASSTVSKSINVHVYSARR